MTTDKAQVEILAETAETLCKEAIAAADTLDRLAETFEYFRGRLVDIAASREDEEAKRSMVWLWDEQIANWRAAAEFVRFGAIDQKQVATELRDMLLLRAPDLLNGNVVELLTERANNIAAAYAGRIMREPK